MAVTIFTSWLEAVRTNLRGKISIISISYYSVCALCPIEFRDYEIFMILWQLIHYRSTLYALLKYLKGPIFKKSIWK